ncbi:type IV secretory system conjugative DNA transfer family protein [Candidatus Gracilibacteria bacterium]|nr:type IV secretory system conjugative DNA transfer family protein [Candidatus Gracilibacteria bacterium]
MPLSEILFIVLSVLTVITILYFVVRKNVAFKRSLEMVFLRVIIARKDSDLDEKKETVKDFREQISIMEQLFASLKSLYSTTLNGWLFGQDYISLEYLAHKEEIYFYIVVPKKAKLLVEKQIIGFYPDCLIEETEEINIFEGRSITRGEIMKLKKGQEFPIRTYQKLESDSMNSLLSALGRLDTDSSACIQILLRPVDDDWQDVIKKKIRKLEKKGGYHFSFNPLEWIGGLINIITNSPEESLKGESHEQDEKDPVDEEGLMKEKVKKTGYALAIRIITTGNDEGKTEAELSNIISAFSQFTSPAYNKFKPVKRKSLSLLIENYIFRKFSWWQRSHVLNSEELATLYHFPHSKYNKQPEIRWQRFKIVKAPTNIAREGLYIGDNDFRGEKRGIFIKDEDRFRHFYVIGQTGTGKSSILSVMMRQDVRAGRGVAVMDPHGDLAKDIINFIPRERADDLVYFDPGDLSRPMGLNLLEATSEDDKQMVVGDATNIMIKLFGNEIFGPRIQDYFRNGCLTLLDYPQGGAITDLIRLFTDENFQRERRTTLKNAVVRAWWDYTYAKMGEREKGEIIPYFAAKFGQFITNSLMRNIVGQTKSAFDIEEIMNNERILLASLSKGILGDLNSNLLGLILVSKIQIAAMKRQKMAAADRRDFFLYIDEFQNFVTDSIESILSEARKYRLGLVLAHQYLGQLQKSDALTKSELNLKDAIFGNVGSIMSYKIGPEDAEMMAKQFAPAYSDQDFINMDKFKAAIKLSVDGQPTPGFSLNVPLPWLEKGDPVIGNALRELSRLKYGREREFVEKEIIYRIGAA